MNTNDSETLRRFAERMAGIEAAVPEPPPLAGQLNTSVVRPRGRWNPLSSLLVIGVVGLGFGVVGLGFIASANWPWSPGTGGAGAGSSTPPGQVAATVEPTPRVPPPTECGRLSDADCEQAIALVHAADPAAVEAAHAIVVDDSCPPRMICDRAYPFASMVVLVGNQGSDTELRAFLVVGIDGPEQLLPTPEALPPHILAEVQALQ